jgi:hypothetical protein
VDRTSAPISGSFPDGPVVLGGQPWTDAMVLDADPISRSLGVRRGMPLGSAHRLAPEATFLDPAPEADAAAVEAALERLAAFSPGLAGTTDPTDPAFGLLEVPVDGWRARRGPALVARLAARLAPILPGPPRAGVAEHGSRRRSPPPTRSRPSRSSWRRGPRPRSSPRSRPRS